jgi:hypothetical protein
MLSGETTTRSDLDPDRLVAKLGAHGVAALREEPHVWVVLDGSDLRKPHATQMEHLQRVRKLDGSGTVPGYATLNVLGIGRERRGILYHRLYSSRAPDFVSEPAEVRTAIRAVGAALAPDDHAVTAILDRGFDDQAVWGELWVQGWTMVCRLKHRDRLVRPTPTAELVPLVKAATRLRERARVDTEMVVQKAGQPRPKLQPVTAQTTARACWLVEVRLARVPGEPWWLLTDRPVETAAQAAEVFRMYCQRWAIEDAFKVAKTCLGLEDVQVLHFDAVRLLVALGWVAAGYLFSLGVTLDWGEVRLLRRLGGGEDRPNRPPGKIVLTRGLRRVLDVLASEAILADEKQRHGGLPPGIAAMLGRNHPTS